MSVFKNVMFISTSTCTLRILPAQDISSLNKGRNNKYEVVFFFAYPKVFVLRHLDFPLIPPSASTSGLPTSGGELPRTLFSFDLEYHSKYECATIKMLSFLNGTRKNKEGTDALAIKTSKTPDS